MKPNYKIILYITCFFISSSNAFALPGAADASRIVPNQIYIPKQDNFKESAISSNVKIIATPDGANKIPFMLKKVRIENMRAFSEKDLKYIYAPYLYKKMTLGVAYEIANKITQHYHNAGYFLSMAYLPEQRIKNGVIVIRLLEGYISEVDVPPEVDNYIVRYYVKKLTSIQPIKILEVEDFLLRLNDLPGYDFRAIFNKETTKEAAVKIKLESLKSPIQAAVSFDNFASRYFGPNEFSAYVNKPFTLQQINFFGLVSAPANKLKYGKIDHKIFFMPNTSLELSRSITRSNPGYSLKALEIKSNSSSTSIGILYQHLRQRKENLSFGFSFYSTDSKTNTINKASLTRDYIRAMKFKIHYNFTDYFLAYNTGELLLSKGIKGLGSSKAGDLNISRDKAIPNFSKVELTLQRLQPLTQHTFFKVSATGQYSANSLYSSEQFGYGGHSFGKAYDSSDITGDHGASAAVEFIYKKTYEKHLVDISPFVFYDVGKVWSIANKKNSNVGASTGLGMRFNTQYGQMGEIVFAMPVKRKIANPIYGLSKRGPRLLLQFTQQM